MTFLTYPPGDVVAFVPFYSLCFGDLTLQVSLCLSFCSEQNAPMFPLRSFDCTWEVILRDRNGLFHLCRGDRVYDRQSGRRGKLLERGRVLTRQIVASKAKQQTTESYWQIQYEDDNDDSVKYVMSRQLIPIFGVDDDNDHDAAPSRCRVLVTDDTETFRMLASSQVTSGCVLEIGCSTGSTSEILWRKPILYWMGWDVSRSMVQTVQQKLLLLQLPDCKQKRLCCQIDALKDPETAASSVIDCFGTEADLTVLVDIGGNREEAAVVLMLHWILTNLNPFKQIIVKSEAVAAALQHENDASAWF